RQPRDRVGGIERLPEHTLKRCREPDEPPEIAELVAEELDDLVLLFDRLLVKLEATLRDLHAKFRRRDLLLDLPQLVPRQLLLVAPPPAPPPHPLPRPRRCREHFH